jgi:ParB/RepB/Spo0J family partition protein
MTNGVLEPILVRKGPLGKPEVINGRQRVRCAREANRRLVAMGSPKLRVPAVVRRDEDSTVFGIAVSANELHQGDQVMAKAIKVQRYLNMGHTEDEAAIQFGVSTTSIDNWLKLLELAPAVKEAVAAGKIRASAAQQLHGLTFDAQKAALDKLLGSGEKPTQRNVKNERPEDRNVPPPRRLLNRIVVAKVANQHVDANVLLGIRYAMGLVKPDRVAGLSALIRSIEAEKKKAEKKDKS